MRKGGGVQFADRLLLMPLEYTQAHTHSCTHTLMGGQPAARLLANGHDFIEKTHKRNDSKHKHNIHSKQYERQTERETDRRRTNTVTIRQILCQTLSQAVRRHPNKFPLAVRLAISMTVSLSTPLSSPPTQGKLWYIYISAVGTRNIIY